MLSSSNIPNSDSLRLGLRGVIPDRRFPVRRYLFILVQTVTLTVSQCHSVSATAYVFNSKTSSSSVSVAFSKFSNRRDCVSIC